MKLDIRFLGSLAAAGALSVAVYGFASREAAVTVERVDFGT